MSQDNFSIRLTKFSPSKIKEHSIVCVIGKRNTGKSVLIKDILYHLKDKLTMGKVISGTDHLNNFYSEFIPWTLISRKYSEETLSKIFERQIKALSERWGYPSTNIFLICDDVFGDSGNWQKSDQIKELFYNGRHYKIYFFLCMQTVLGINDKMRSNIDYIFILKNNKVKDRERIYQHYAGAIPSFDIFNSIMDSCTQDYGCLVIDNVTQSNRLEDQVFFYKAQHPLNYKLCSQKIWNTLKEKPKLEHNFNKETYITKKNKRCTIIKD